jgi:hypothetical protein
MRVGSPWFLYSVEEILLTGEARVGNEVKSPSITARLVVPRLTFQEGSCVGRELS